MRNEACDGRPEAEPGQVLGNMFVWKMDGLLEYI